MKIIEEHKATVVEYSHTPMSGLVTMYVQPDDWQGLLMIHGDYSCMVRIAEAYPPGSRCKVALPDEGFENWIVTDENAERVET